MKRSLAVVAFLFLGASAPRAADMPAAVAGLVAAERAFAKMSVDVSMRDAFLANLGDGAVLFNPGPVDGRALYEAKAPADVLLAWEPSYAEIAASGDFGFTTGPWQFSRDRTSEPVAFGHFVSVWKKQGGDWKVAVDLGIGHDRLESQPALTFRASDDPRVWPPDARVVAAALSELLAADRAFAKAAARSAADAYREYAAADARRYRDGAPPVLGVEAVARAVGEGGAGSMRAAAADIAASGDLGYTTGSRGEPVAAYYVRIWRLDAKLRWRLVLDIENPVPADGE